MQNIDWIYGWRWRVPTHAVGPRDLSFAGTILSYFYSFVIPCSFHVYFYKVNTLMFKLFLLFNLVLEEVITHCLGNYALKSG